MWFLCSLTRGLNLGLLSLPPALFSPGLDLCVCNTCSLVAIPPWISLGFLQQALLSPTLDTKEIAVLLHWYILSDHDMTCVPQE